VLTETATIGGDMIAVEGVFCVNSCVHRLCRPDILVMEAAEQTDRCDEPHGLHRPMQWRILVKRKVRADFIMVDRMMCQQLTEVPFPEHRDMVRVERGT
jgi:hypothetical protein